MKKKILIVDDEKGMVSVVEALFEIEGWVTAAAFDGEEALRLILEFQPDVILSDINMPRKDGLVLLQDLDYNDIHIPLIFLSAFRDLEKMKKAWGYGAFDFIDKPYDERSLLQLAENALKFGRDYTIAARARYKKVKSVA